MTDKDSIFLVLVFKGVFKSINLLPIDFSLHAVCKSEHHYIISAFFFFHLDWSLLSMTLTHCYFLPHRLCSAHPSFLSALCGTTFVIQGMIYSIFFKMFLEVCSVLPPSHLVPYHMQRHCTKLWPYSVLHLSHDLICVSQKYWKILLMIVEMFVLIFVVFIEGWSVLNNYLILKILLSLPYCTDDEPWCQLETCLVTLQKVFA